MWLQHQALRERGQRLIFFGIPCLFHPALCSRLHLGFHYLPLLFSPPLAPLYSPLLLLFRVFYFISPYHLCLFLSSFFLSFYPFPRALPSSLLLFYLLSCIYHPAFSIISLAAPSFPYPSSPPLPRTFPLLFASDPSLFHTISAYLYLPSLTRFLRISSRLEFPLSRLASHGHCVRRSVHRFVHCFSFPPPIFYPPSVLP